MSVTMKPKAYTELIVWQKGIELVKQIYQMTKGFPTEKRFGLVSQMRRAAVSVPSNIAEDQARRSIAEFKQFVSISLGSLAELETQVVISVELGYCSKSRATDVFQSVHELQRMLHSLRSKLATNH